VAQGFADAFQPVQDCACGENVGGIRALPSTGLDKLVFTEALKEGIKELLGGGF
jgi:hypothetical protein